jgi:hypothetical protein
MGPGDDEEGGRSRDWCWERCRLFFWGAERAPPRPRYITPREAALRFPPGGATSRHGRVGQPDFLAGFLRVPPISSPPPAASLCYYWSDRFRPHASAVLPIQTFGHARRMWWDQPGGDTIRPVRFAVAAGGGLVGWSWRPTSTAAVSESVSCRVEITSCFYFLTCVNHQS